MGDGLNIPTPLEGPTRGGWTNLSSYIFFFEYVYIYMWKKVQIDKSIYIYIYIIIYIYTYSQTPQKRERLPKGIAWKRLISLDHMNDNGLVMWQAHRTYENLLDTSWHILKHLNTSWRHSLASFLLRPGVEHRHWAIDLPALLIGVYWGHR